MDAAINLDELLGPDTSAEGATEELSQNVVEPEVAQATEKDILPDSKEEVAQPETQVENKQSPEQIAENYKRMAHAERMERKHISEQMKVMQARFEQLLSVVPKQEQPAAPVYEDDPLGATFDKVEKVAQKLERLEQTDAQRQQQDNFNGFVRNVQADEANFMVKTPDYKEAVNFIQHRRLQELQVMGYPEEQAMKVLSQDAYAVTQRAIALGESPASFAYNMAKKLGYSPKQQDASQTNIDTIAEGQKVARSVSGGASVVSEGSLPNNLAEMSDAAFEALFKQMSKG